MTDDLSPELSPSDASIAEAKKAASVMPFEDLEAPQPIAATPPPQARWLAFIGVIVGGLLGGLIGYGVGDILMDSQVWAAFGALLFGVGCAVGVGIVSALTLRAMNEWREVHHPEADS